MIRKPDARKYNSSNNNYPHSWGKENSSANPPIDFIKTELP